MQRHQPEPLSAAEALIQAQTHDTRIHCPQCAHTRKRHRNPTLSVTVKSDHTVYCCHHCGWSGALDHDRPQRPPDMANVTFIPTELNQEQQLIKEFFRARGVPIQDMAALPPMVTGRKLFRGMGEVDAIGFVYGPLESPRAIKWRALNAKAFTQSGAAREFYGLGQLPHEPKELIIVEGECDAVALAAIGVKAISCPNGAPQKVSRGRVSPEDDGKFGYIWEARELLDGATKIVLATDQDEPGEALAEEIARRVGRAKCWRVKYPEGCKDITDVLAIHGIDAVATALNTAQPLPLAGVYSALDYQNELLELYREGHGRGESTGMAVVDELFTIKPGQLTVVTGLPGSGKSEFVDQIMVNLAQKSRWRFAVASFENPPSTHIAKLAEKITGKPFYEGVTPRMRSSELNEALAFINERFVFLESKDGHMPTMESIIDRTKQAVMRLGVRGLVIDPYNYIQHPANTDEPQSISRMLSTLTTFAKAHDLHVFFVAHPAKMYPKEDGSYPIPKGMAISGSAAWFAKADVGITVHRGKEGVEIHCWKVRFKWIGRQGMTLLGYDVPSGRYLEQVPAKNNDWDNLTVNKSSAKEPNLKHWQDVDPAKLDF